MIYERALAAFPLTHFLWLAYTRYLEAHLKISAVINAVFARAVRNTPWVGVVWARAINALERRGASDNEQAAVYQRAIVAGLQVRASSFSAALVRRKPTTNSTAPLWGIEVKQALVMLGCNKQTAPSSDETAP